jgi:hypothetical protein
VRPGEAMFQNLALERPLAVLDLEIAGGEELLDGL